MVPIYSHPRVTISLTHGKAALGEPAAEEGAKADEKNTN